MDAATINAWFTPFHYIVYLGTVFIAMVVYCQWKWSKTCKNNIQVLVAQQGGGGEFFLAPKNGGEVTIKNPHTGTNRTWAVNELATIDVLYPGVGFVPAFLQKSIRMAIVSEGDWEPLLNRSPHLKKVASPDMVLSLNKIIESCKDEAIKDRLSALLEGVSTAPTREMIASPAVLGNLMHEKITEAVITVNKEVVDSIANLVNKFKAMVNPYVVYIGLGLIVILSAYIVYQTASITELKESLDLIKMSLGIQPVVMP